MTRKYWLFALPLLVGTLTTGCGDDSTSNTGTDTDDSTSTSGTTSTTGTTGTTTGTSTSDGSTSTTGTSTTTDTDGGSTSDTTGPLPPEMAEFTVTIENISGDTWYPTGFSPVVWVEHTLGSAPMFAVNGTASAGLITLAEDGDPTALADEMDGATDVVSAGSYDVPETAGGTGPIAPGDSYVFNVTAQQGSRLSLASMLGQSNDIFLGTGPQGVALFTNAGFPQDERDVTVNLQFWEAGSEANQAVLGGGYSGASQSAANTGPDESGVVSVRNESTHQIPQASRLASVDVTYDAKSTIFTIVIDNLSDATSKRAMETVLSPAVWALHDDTFTMFTPGAAASDNLETLAEDGDPAALRAEIDALGSVAASAVTAAAPVDGSITFEVTPSGGDRFLSFATMVAETNDAFIANAEGVALLNAGGTPRTTADIEEDFARLLRVWDAGTEVNETPGAGFTQQPRQGGANTGADEGGVIGYYIDTTNDLDATTLASALSVEIVNDTGGDTHIVSITNDSDNTGYRFTLSDISWVVHDGSVSPFTLGSAASANLESLAEDGVTTGIDTDFAAAVTATDAAASGFETSIAAGENATWGIDASETHSYITFIAQVQPSNDTFVAFTLNLYNGSTELDDAELATAVAAAPPVAYDAGTEANQVGACGPDQFGLQAAVNTGADEGSGSIQTANDKDTVWVYPEPSDIVRVTIAPVE